jgi:hypothetical protein
MTDQVDVEGIKQQEAILKALKNMGHDTTCGACMLKAFTGDGTMRNHTCRTGKFMAVTGVVSGLITTVDQVINGLETYRDEFKDATDHLYFLQAIIAANLKEIGMPEEAYLHGCTQAWNCSDDKPTETIPRNTH